MEFENKALTKDDTLVKYFNIGVTNALSKYFDVKCCEKGHEWFEPWNGHFRKSFSLFAPKGTRYPILWGYNADFIPSRQNSGKFIYFRTEKAGKVHVEDSFFNHVHYDPDKMTHMETYNIRGEYCLTMYNDHLDLKDIEAAYKYAEEITLRNIPFMLKYYEQVKTVDDMINFLDNHIEPDNLFHSYNLYYEKAFLLAYKKQMDEAINTLRKIHPDYVDDEILKRLHKAYELE